MAKVSIELTVSEYLNNKDGVAEFLESLTGEDTESSGKKDKKKSKQEEPKKETKKSKKSSAKKETKKPKKGGVTAKAFKKALSDFLEENEDGRDIVKSVSKEFSVKSIKELEKDQYTEYLEALENARTEEDDDDDDDDDEDDDL